MIQMAFYFLQQIMESYVPKKFSYFPLCLQPPAKTDSLSEGSEAWLGCGH